MRRYTDAERRRAVKDFECGGISAAGFCRRRGMSSVSLAQWRRRYSGSTHSSPAAVPPWLPVGIADAGPPAVDASVVYVMIAGWPSGSGRRR
jgi:transposase-like protein